jgi:hypothetical protein
MRLGPGSPALVLGYAGHSQRHLALAAGLLGEAVDVCAAASTFRRGGERPR